VNHFNNAKTPMLLVKLVTAKAFDSEMEIFARGDATIGLRSKMEEYDGTHLEHHFIKNYSEWSAWMIN
jgi:hypothetical protein